MIKEETTGQKFNGVPILYGGHNKSSEVAEMGDHGHNRHGQKLGGLCPF